MVNFSAMFSCFVPSSSSSSRVSDDAEVSNIKGSNVQKPKSKSKSSSSAPIVVSYFPINSYMSRL
ncbi:hypothetical protein JCGZ_16711 [Jatropha curcas]|uniref:Uncharacterized protein n=1 Tax=Jatropha curcas TaxID=180498 RepID=A0A067LGW0_JATCU|nr:uncharacterized protein LOC119371215 [Jatropha curcas]XP_037496888.1 uncharacterized protein LOC119371215 [Jatropha curcas]KDP43423.1 hypothetical protein JCGZ_16710 [Jatropha curcas]KDP43424.1 hypothetical protein JCGZ_16711 [Jatropha curcas]